MFKKMFVTVLLASSFVLQVSAQVFNVPEKAKEHFKTHYKNVQDVDWKNNVSDYNCYFTEADVKCRANYHLDGTWNYTEKAIASASIPEKVSTSFSNSLYRDWEVKSVFFVENNKKEKLYRYEAKKGIKVTYVFFDKSGKLIKENPTI